MRKGFFCIFYKENIGGIMPSPASPVIREKTLRPMMKIPIEAKNNAECFDFENVVDPYDRKASMGSVPRANAPIMRDPDMPDPLESAATCMAWVKPQGRKKVANPSASGAYVVCSIRLKKLKNFGEMVMLFFLYNPDRFSPKNNIIIDVNIPIMAEKV